MRGDSGRAGAGSAIALVTGAGSGIGAATAQALAAVGWRVVCAGRRLERLREVAASIGDQARAVTLDVTDADAVAALPDDLPEGWREIEVLVNNAGHDVGGRRRFDEGEADEWASIVETNVIGLIRVTRALIPAMVARDSGHVVNIGSVAGLKPYAGGTIYAATKHAVHGFSESLRLDFERTGVRVTEIMPGMVRTEFAGARLRDAGAGERFYDDHGTCLAPDDVARTVVFAVSQPPHVDVAHLLVMPAG